MKRLIMFFATLVMVAFVPSAVAASGTLFGGATMSGNQVQLVSNLSDTSTANDSSGINFTNTGVTTFSTLTQLATKFTPTHNSCGGGSPRFQINFGSQNAFVYLGPSPTFTGCAPNAQVDSGNLVGNNDPCRWDTSQLQAGTQCNTYTGALALLGSRTVTGIQLVVDSGWFFTDKQQTFLVCDIRINDSTVFHDRRERDEDERRRQPSVDAPQRPAGVEPLPEERVEQRRQVRRRGDREGQGHEASRPLAAARTFVTIERPRRRGASLLGPSGLFASLTTCMANLRHLRTSCHFGRWPSRKRASTS